ncbi:MAG: sugar ABC transporter ATP-binding protein [Candidatus Sumerlaeota bacterium]|nr:sugar ABC transporter ATP-binding protein [Candidatus Sumerlaeota bacterium]
MASLLEVQDIEKHYDGVYALQKVRFEVAAGETHALIGENGAGKSTLAKIVAGVVKPDAGRIFFDGRAAAIHHPLDAQKLGIGIIFQELDLFQNLTVAENIAICNAKTERGQYVNFAAMERFCQPFMDQVGLRCPPGARLGDLPVGQMQLTAIARALSMDARLILMDEPTSALTDDDVERLFSLIRALTAKGVSIVYVSHKMQEIFRISDRITVLRDGQYIGTLKTSETGADEIITMMVGRELKDSARNVSHRGAQTLLSVKNLSTAKLADISFDLYAGEVLGIAGLVGAGRSELGAALFGLDPVTGGRIELEGRPLAPGSAREAMAGGIGLLPEDRKLQGLMMRMSVKENTTIAMLPRLATGGFIRQGAEMESARRVLERSAIKTSSYDAPVSSLSGGNQQKALLGRWLLVDPKVLFLDDPTRGIDVGAKRDIYGIIEELAARGKGVILVSSELPELLRCCDRIMVLHDGRNMGIVDARETTQEQIMALATAHENRKD